MHDIRVSNLEHFKRQKTHIPSWVGITGNLCTEPGEMAIARDGDDTLGGVLSISVVLIPDSGVLLGVLWGDIFLRITWIIS